MAESSEKNWQAGCRGGTGDTRDFLAAWIFLALMLQFSHTMRADQPTFLPDLGVQGPCWSRSRFHWVR